MDRILPNLRCPRRATTQSNNLPANASTHPNYLLKEEDEEISANLQMPMLNEEREHEDDIIMYEAAEEFDEVKGELGDENQLQDLESLVISRNVNQTSVGTQITNGTGDNADRIQELRAIRSESSCKSNLALGGRIANFLTWASGIGGGLYYVAVNQAFDAISIDMLNRDVIFGAGCFTIVCIGYGIDSCIKKVYHFHQARQHLAEEALLAEELQR